MATDAGTMTPSSQHESDLKACDEAFEKDKRGGTPTGEWGARYTSEDYQRAIEIGFRRGFKAGASHARAEERKRAEVLVSALVGIWDTCERTADHELHHMARVEIPDAADRALAAYKREGGDD